MRIMSIIAAAALAVAGVISSTAAIPPCDYEDGAGQSVCYWDAASWGNRRGESYVLVDGEPVARW